MCLFNSVASKNTQNTLDISAADSLNVTMKVIDANKDTYAFQVKTRKNSWLNVYLFSDTIKDKIKIADDYFTYNNTSQKTVWMYSDSTATLQFTLQLLRRNNITYNLWLTRTDTLKDKNILRAIQKKISL